MSDLWGAIAEPLSYPFMRRALVASMLLGTSGGLLGCYIVLRRLSLMGDALAHSLLPGMAIAYLLFGTSVWSLFAGALGAGMLTALGSGLITRLTRIKEDASFGALFLLFFGLGVAIVSAARERVQVDLLHFLFGDVLGIASSDLYLALGTTSLTLLAFAVFYRNIAIESFDPIFYRSTGRSPLLAHLGMLALVVLNLVSALQAMGAVLALGLFLLPAVTAYILCNRWSTMLLLSAVIAVLGSTGGLYASYHLGIASGPCIVVTLGIVFLTAALLSPRGVLGLVISPKRRPDYPKR
ncbi:MAG: metal ABC transporter permease [Sumerlaeia bacterium]